MTPMQKIVVFTGMIAAGLVLIYAPHFGASITVNYPNLLGRLVLVGAFTYAMFCAYRGNTRA